MEHSYSYDLHNWICGADLRAQLGVHRQERAGTVLIRQHFTADSLNMVVNDPSVYEWSRGAATGRIDLTPVVQNDNNVLLMDEYGGVLFLKHQPGVYEAHTQVLPAGRGKWALDMVNQALSWMFTRTDCVDITTRVPKGNLAARALARAIHGTPEFRLEKGWIKDGQIIYADIFSLRIQDWMSKAPGLEEVGQKFHHQLEEEFERLGQEVELHSDDPVHDRYVGATSLMIPFQPQKSVIFYNRWAGMAGYQPIRIVSENPIVVDINNSLLAIENESFYVLRIK